MKKKLFPLLLFTLLCQSVLGQKVIKTPVDNLGTEIQYIDIGNQAEENVRDFIKADATAKGQELKKRGLGYILLDYRNEDLPDYMGSYELVEYINKPESGIDYLKIPYYYTVVNDYPVILFMDNCFIGYNPSNPINKRILAELIKNRIIPLTHKYVQEETVPSLIEAPPYRRSQRYYVAKYNTGPRHDMEIQVEIPTKVINEQKKVK